MKVDRKLLLKELETASAGLSKRVIIEQGGCFVFKAGEVFTFNDEVAVRTACTLKIEGAVQAKPLLELLQKMSEDELDISVVESGLQVKGKGRRGTIHMEEKVLLPVEGIEDPGEWGPIPKGLLAAMKVVASCCSTDESRFVLTCVHVATDCVEASDDFQMIRYPLKTKIKKSALLVKDSVEKLTSVDTTEWSESENWLHFRNAAGSVLCCRRYAETYPDFGNHLEVEGHEVSFPKILDKALDKAQIFSAEDPIENKVTVSLSPGRLRLEGKGPLGSYREQKKIEYDGIELSFLIEPRLLLEIAAKSDKCVVGKTRIKVDTGKFVYVSVTTAIKE
jgi:hypothetical protein